MIGARFVVAGFAAMLVAAQARAADPIVLQGEYDFSSFEPGPSGAPLCHEQWSFGTDGTLTKRSGREIVTYRFHTEAANDGIWLVTDQPKTNGEPDCVGHAQKGGYPDGEDRDFIYGTPGGGIVVSKRSEPKDPQSTAVLLYPFGELTRAKAPSP